MQNDTGDDRIKADMLALMNESRAHLGKEPLKVFPERSCSFCGRPEAESGPLFRGDVIEFIRICRACAGKAQRSFVAGLLSGKGGAHES